MFAKWIAPLSIDEFILEYWGRKMLCLPADARRAAQRIDGRALAKELGFIGEVRLDQYSARAHTIVLGGHGELDYYPPGTCPEVQGGSLISLFELSTATVISRVLVSKLESKPAWRSAPPPCPPELQRDLAEFFRERIRELKSSIE
jgi:hypothetical protein